jgi:hypothetical protein
MSEDLVVAATRVGWLTLTLMMLLSRVVFQAAGPERMRAFLDRWMQAPVRRAWGAVSLAFAALLVAGAIATGPTGWDLAILLALVAILVADGLVNVLPSGFKTFKDTVQEAWVSRHEGTGREGDRHLFGTINLVLAAASAAVAALVLLYAPIATGTVILAVVLALVIFPALALLA